MEKGHERERARPHIKLGKQKLFSRWQQQNLFSSMKPKLSLQTDTQLVSVNIVCARERERGLWII